MMDSHQHRDRVTRRTWIVGSTVLATASLVGAMAGVASGSVGRASPHSTVTTISFAESGLGTEGAQTAKAISAFEKANPSIKVHIDVLSSDSTTYLQQIEQRFIAGSTSPDVLESDVTYPAKFAQAGWIKSLSSYKPDMGKFFPTEVAAGKYKGSVYAIPWFDNPEGLFYRTDLIKSPPKSPSEVVSDAKAAMKKDHALKEGLAFEGVKYEGAITALMTVDAAFGGKLTLANVASKGNVAALAWLQSAIYKSKIAPQAVTGWEEGAVQQEFTSGHAAFAIDYPFVEGVASSGGPAKGHVGYIPFPAGPGGKPGAALGGEMLAINAKSTHAAAAWKLISYLTGSSVEIARAEATGDPPSIPSAYTSALYAKAPYFKQVKVLNDYAQPRPVDPRYLQASADLQVATSSAFSNTASASSALSSAASQISSLTGSAG